MQIHELTNVAPAGLGGTEYVAADNGAVTRKLNLSDLILRAGQTVTIGNYAAAAAYWAGNNSLRFSVPTNKIIVAESAQMTAGTLYIRTAAGNSGAVDLTAAGITVTAYVQPVGLTFKVDWDTAPSYAQANQVATLQISGLTVALS